MGRSVLNWNKISSILISTVLIGYLVIHGQTFLAPLVFAIFLSILLLPMYNFLYRWIPVDWLVIVLSFLII
ncbi:MAG TPA: hypothetical protein VKZ56_08175, partial [Membranihabitans sp.]|nr:hypothetical protein [Membranihabitans sp.]